MYVVISTGFHFSDSTITQTVIHCVSAHPDAVLSVARCTAKGEDKDFISTICIYNVEIEKAYTIEDFKDEENCPLVYLSYKNIYDEKIWNEKFFKEFEVYNKKITL